MASWAREFVRSLRPPNETRARLSAAGRAAPAPRLVDCCCGLAEIDKLREPVCSGLAGDVLELCSGAGQIGLLAVADSPGRRLVCVDVNPAAAELTTANAAYNQMVGSFESQVIPQARRFEGLGAGSAKELDAPPMVEIAPRPLTKAIPPKPSNEDDAAA